MPAGGRSKATCPNRNALMRQWDLAWGSAPAPTARAPALPGEDKRHDDALPIGHLSTNFGGVALLVELSLSRRPVCWSRIDRGHSPNNRPDASCSVRAR